MKKLILAVLAAGTVVLGLGPIQAGAHGGGWGGGGWGYHGGWGYRGGWGWGYPAFGFGVASGVMLGSALASPWYYDGYYNYPYYGYYGGPYYRSSYHSAPNYQPAPTAAQPASAPVATQQPTTVINNYYYNSSPMSSANALFGR